MLGRLAGHTGPYRFQSSELGFVSEPFCGRRCGVLGFVSLGGFRVSVFGGFGFRVLCSGAFNSNLIIQVTLPVIRRILFWSIPLHPSVPCTDTLGIKLAQKPYISRGFGPKSL